MWQNLCHMSEGQQNEATKASADAEGQLAQPKWFLASKTVLGAAVVVLPHAFKLLGIAFEDSEIQNLATTGSAFLGAILAVWGRATAKQPVSLKPQKPIEYVASAVMVGAIGSLALQGCETVPVQAQVCYEPTPGVKVCATRATNQTDLVASFERDGVSAKAIVPITGGAR